MGDSKGPRRMLLDEHRRIMAEGEARLESAGELVTLPDGAPAKVVLHGVCRFCKAPALLLRSLAHPIRTHFAHEQPTCTAARRAVAAGRPCFIPRKVKA